MGSSSSFSYGNMQVPLFKASRCPDRTKQNTSGYNLHSKVYENYQASLRLIGTTTTTTISQYTKQEHKKFIRKINQLLKNKLMAEAKIVFKITSYKIVKSLIFTQWATIKLRCE